MFRRGRTSRESRDEEEEATTWKGKKEHARKGGKGGGKFEMVSENQCKEIGKESA